MDYTFYGMNQACLPIALDAAMQIGNALQCILQCLVYCNTSYGPLLMVKIDLADGYYRVSLSPQAALTLAVIIPSDIPTQDAFIGLPLALPLGWAHSPPYFCAFIETIMDIANMPHHAPIHPAPADTQCAPLPTIPQFHPNVVMLGSPHTPILSYTDIYIDNFVVIAQAPKHLPAMNSLLTAIETVFQDPSTMS